MKSMADPRLVTVVASSLLLLAAHASVAQARESEQVSLRFSATVAGEAFACGKSYDGVGTTQSRITPVDLRFYVSDVALIDSQGRAVPVELRQDDKWQYRNVALLDFEDGSGPCRNGTPGVNEEVVGSVPTARYSGIRFTLGVPFELNHIDPTIAPSPLNLTAMFWVWQSGFRFLKLDMATTGQPLAASAARGPSAAQDIKGPAGFPVHIGSTQCASPGPTNPPASCANPNRVVVELDHFDITRNSIVIDIAALLDGTNVDINAPKTPPGCMSTLTDSDCTAILRTLGLPHGTGTAGSGVNPRVFQLR